MSEQPEFNLNDLTRLYKETKRADQLYMYSCLVQNPRNPCILNCRQEMTNQYYEYD